MNGEKIGGEGPVNIELNDKVQIGPFVLRFSDSGSPADPVSPLLKKVEAKPEGGDVSEQFRQEFGNFSELYEENVMKLIRNIHEDVLEKLNLSKDAIKLVNNSDMQLKVEQSLDLALNERRHEIPVTLSRDLLRQTLLDELVGFGPLSRLLRSHKISEIMINGPSNIFVEYQGVCYPTEARFFNEQHLISIIQRIVEPLGRHIDEASPMVDARLPDGSRVNAIIPPLALRGASVTIRKFADKKLTTDDPGDGVVSGNCSEKQKKHSCFRRNRIGKNNSLECPFPVYSSKGTCYNSRRFSRIEINAPEFSQS